MRTTVVHKTASEAPIIAAEAALLESNPQAVGAVLYQPSIDRDTQMLRHEDLEAKDGHNLKLD